MRFFIFVPVMAVLLITTSNDSYAKLLDKVVAVVDNNIITLSLLNRTSLNITSRKNLAPQIFVKDKYNDKEVAKVLVRSFLVKSKLNEIGFTVTDDQVEQQIKSTEDRLGLSRDKLLQFLKSNNTTFDEYFELIRSSIEYSIFYQRVITPLVSITEQDIKNSFYKSNLNNKALAFRYGLIDYSFPRGKIGNDIITKLPDVVKKYQSEGQISADLLSGLESTEIGDISEEGLSKELKEILKNTDEGSMAKAITMNDRVHVFFVKRKDLVESESFTKAKERIKEQLFIKQANEMVEIWHEREENKHYVKYFL